ncbi:zinc finger BED domain-containing protein RICESLEEPER 1-like isoform X1 [Mangifera indica]|uniref:zinc finger BED domain-containing protein RICESLEEPER 1-like isoform X1 n=1 Tax=Mangifera indica TaxID=29780 RepID=UPI001CFA5665|nr:zinc finger BED domain-containing protein RICESLEEPER 1-like isoform X1 [Mangifera indica]
MDLRNIQVSPREYLQLRKFKISEEIKCLKDFVHQYNSIPEMRDDIMDYLQSLRQDLQDIESSMQHGKQPVSFNVNGIYQYHGQEITQQNVYFGPTLNQENDVVMGPNAQSLSCSKRKRWSKVWEDFTKYIGQDGKEWAKCKHCKKEFVGSSKSGTTHLKNHLQSCLGLRNPSAVADKVKEKSMIGTNLNGSDFVQRIIKYGLNGIKDDILVVYEQVKCKFHGYIDKLPSRVSVTFDRWCWNGFWFMNIWFVDDSWELRNMIIFVANCEDEDEDDGYEIFKSLLVDWNIHTKMFSMFICHGEPYEEVTQNLNNWFNEGGSLPFIGTDFPSYALYNIFYWEFFNDLKEISPNNIIAKASKLRDYVCTPSNGQKFGCAVHQALSMGKIVTSQSVPPRWGNSIRVFKWVMGCKEAFNELEHIDPDFKFINFTKEDWDDAKLLYSGWQVLGDYKKEILKLRDSEYKTETVNFKFIRDIFFKLVQLRKSDNYYICHIASLIKKRLAEYWKNSRSILEVGVILDPRCKLKMVENIYKMIYDNDSEIHLQKAIDDVTNIFNEYVKGMSSSSSSHDYNITSKSELDCYLRDEFPQDEMFDILQWWRDKSPVYPTLAKMARDFLSMPSELPYVPPYFKDGIQDIYACNDLDDDFVLKLAYTKYWLNFFESN